MSPVQLVSDSWRERVYHLARNADRSLLLAAPFIKEKEARSIAELASPARKAGGLSLVVLTDLRPESILNDSLDIEALGIFAREFRRSQVFSVPRLHAKVYIADTARAIIGSANLTPSALDQNREYGVLIDDASVVRQIEDDMWRFARLGSSVEPGALNQLQEIAAEVKSEYQALQRSASANLRRRFSALLRRAHRNFVATQVGSRSANAVFSEAIMYLLTEGPRATRELQPRVQGLLPDLCDDSAELVINGESFGKKWKHHVRNAQQSLKRAGRIRLDGTLWRRIDA
jgi:hypothetical protein